jgi:hypothetical protein
MFNNKKSKMMIEAVKFKIDLIDGVLTDVYKNGADVDQYSKELYECHVAQKVILKGLLHELEMIESGKAII